MHCKSGKAACNYISSVAGLVNKLCFTDYQRGTKPLGQIVSECKSQTIKMRVIKFQNQVRNKSYEKERNNHKTWLNETIPSLSLLTTTYDCSSFTERKALSSERVIGYIVICSTILHPSFLPKKKKINILPLCHHIQDLKPHQNPFELIGFSSHWNRFWECKLPASKLNKDVGSIQLEYR